MDSSRQRYGLKPLGLCNQYDGCNAAFTVAHALSCKQGGLVSIRHNDARLIAGALRSSSLLRIRSPTSVYHGFVGYLGCLQGLHCEGARFVARVIVAYTYQATFFTTERVGNREGCVAALTLVAKPQRLQPVPLAAAIHPFIK